MFTFTIAVLGVVVACCLFVSVVNDKPKHQLWQHADTVGIPSRGFLAQTRAILKSVVLTRRYTHEGYNKFSRTQQRPFVISTMWTGGPVFVLPRSVLHLLRKPDTQLRAFDAQLETFRWGNMIKDRDVYTNLIQFEVLRKHMTHSKDIERVAPATADELDIAFKTVWGESNEWVTANAWESCGRIIMQAAMRVFVGPDHCRDEDLLTHSREFSTSIITNSLLINCIPSAMRPMATPILTFQARRRLGRCLDVLLPIVKERLRIWESGDKTGEEPNDFIQWMIQRCSKEGPREMEPDRLAIRVLLMQTMFVVGMVHVFTHCILDLYSTPSKEEFLGDLEEECQRVQTPTGFRSKDTVDRLYRVDSAIRESMRFSDLHIFGLARDVVSSSIDIGHGITLAPGTRVVWPTQPIHRDPEFYPEPDRFDAFRFSRDFEGLDGDKPGKSADRLLTASVTPSFLAFGYGKHECPGRWFSAQTMKQALAHVILNYDVEVVKKLETRGSLLNLMIPQTEATIRIRRKNKNLG